MKPEPAKSPERSTAEPAPGAVEYRGTGFYVGLVIILVAVVLLLILSVQNTRSVTLSFLGFDVEIPLFAVVIGAGLVAVVLDELVGLVWRSRRRRRLSERVELQRLRSAAAGAPPQGEAPERQAPQGEAAEPAVDPSGDDAGPDTGTAEPTG